MNLVRECSIDETEQSFTHTLREELIDMDRLVAVAVHHSPMLKSMKNALALMLYAQDHPSRYPREPMNVGARRIN